MISLEDELDVELFIRAGKKLFLTQAGFEMKKQVDMITLGFDEISGLIKNCINKPNERLRINMLSGKVMGPNIVTLFHTTHPSANFELATDWYSEDYDIKIYSVPSYSESRSDTMILEEKIMLAVPRDYPLCRQKTVSFSDLIDVPFILLTGYRNTLGEMAQYAFQTENIKPYICYSDDSIISAMHAAHLGYGVTLWPEFSCGILNDPTIVLLPVKSPSLSRRLYVSWPSGRPLTSTCADFIEFIMNYYRNIHDYTGYNQYILRC